MKTETWILLALLLGIIFTQLGRRSATPPCPGGECEVVNRPEAK
jgi:hypothetical protein